MLKQKHIYTVTEIKNQRARSKIEIDDGIQWCSVVSVKATE